MIVLTDLDDTLVAENSTYGFVQAALEEAGRTRAARAVGRVRGRVGLRGLFFAALHKAAGTDRARPWALRHLRGLPRSFLQEVGAAYARSLWTRAPLETPRHRLAALRSGGGRVVVVSASLEEVVGPIAEILGAEHRASRLGYDAQGLCTGRLDRDLTGRKVASVEGLLASGEPVAVLTDNVTDADLLARADHRLVVVDRASDRSAWSELQPEFVVVDR